MSLFLEGSSDWFLTLGLYANAIFQEQFYCDIGVLANCYIDKITNQLRKLKLFLCKNQKHFLIFFSKLKRFLLLLSEMLNKLKILIESAITPQDDEGQSSKSIFLAPSQLSRAIFSV